MASSPTTVPFCAERCHQPDMHSAPTFPGLGGEKWVAGVRVGKARAWKGARPQPRILGQREKKHSHSQSGSGRPPLLEMEKDPQIQKPSKSLGFLL